MTEVFVCQAGACRRKGSEAVLLEIEELANAVDGHCSVQGSGCLGYCARAPNAIVMKDGRRSSQMHTQIDSLEKSIELVTSATGVKPPIDNPQVQSRLAGVRLMRVREHAISVHRWSAALQAVSDQIVAGGESASREIIQLSAEIAAKAGYPQGIPDNPCMPSEIEMYTKWSLEEVTKLSRHSAVFHFRSKDRKRYTPNPRGGGRGKPVPKTWHITLLGLVGPNAEGPVPWVERDYTPVSTALEWERGQCSILIKIYHDGAATSWLHRVMAEASISNEPLFVWLSRPVQTLSVPTLVTGTLGFHPASLLLLLAGTGVVALPQIIQHRDPQRKLGISTRRIEQLHVPIDLVLSCRSDDVLMLPEITNLCQEASDFSAANPDAPIVKGLRRCTLLLTDATPSQSSPFPDFSGSEAELAELQSKPNARALHTRLSSELVLEAMSHMPMPCRVVVSGPSAFNAAAREMLIKIDVDADAITVLEA